MLTLYPTRDTDREFVTSPSQQKTHPACRVGCQESLTPPTCRAASRPAPPGPRPAGRSARGTASSSRSPSRPCGRRRTLSGSPPCSPQMPTFRCWPCFALRLSRPFLMPIFDQLADAVDVDRLERVDRQDLLLQVRRHEPLDVVAAEAERHLRQVVGAEAEELGLLGDLVRRRGTPAAARSSCRSGTRPSRRPSSCTPRRPRWPAS